MKRYLRLVTQTLRCQRNWRAIKSCATCAAWIYHQTKIRCGPSLPVYQRNSSYHSWRARFSPLPQKHLRLVIARLSVRPPAPWRLSPRRSKIGGSGNDNCVTEESGRGDGNTTRSRRGALVDKRSERWNAKSNLKIKCDIFIEMRRAPRRRCGNLYACIYTYRRFPQRCPPALHTDAMHNNGLFRGGHDCPSR